MTVFREQRISGAGFTVGLHFVCCDCCRKGKECRWKNRSAQGRVLCWQRSNLEPRRPPVTSAIADDFVPHLSGRRPAVPVKSLDYFYCSLTLKAAVLAGLSFNRYLLHLTPKSAYRSYP